MDDGEESRSQIEEALVKRAKGFQAEEEVLEYSVNSFGKEELSKRKVKKYFVPPDLSAIKILLDKQEEDCMLTAEELEEEKERLVKQFAILIAQVINEAKTINPPSPKNLGGN